MAAQVRLRDRLPMPRSPEGVVVATANRHDRYTVSVCRHEQTAIDLLCDEIGDRRVALITDHKVAQLHARRLADTLTDTGLDVATTAFPAGEANKSLTTATELLDWLAGTALARRDIVLAVGGGVVIDTVGWVASAYMRGVPYINVPTTLLAHVDAALGGKVAVDHATAKNLIGAFYQPKSVVSNVGYLHTLELRQLRAGLAEVIKKGVIASPELFEFIERHYDDILATDPMTTANLVHGASVVKCNLIAKDPYEQDLRRALNFGHTIGHAVETVTGYGPVLHGEAVAFGMACAARIAERRGLLDWRTSERLTDLLIAVGLPVVLDDLPVPLDPAATVGALQQIRKIRDGGLRFVLPVALGEAAIVDDVTEMEVRAAITAEAEADGLWLRTG